MAIFKFQKPDKVIMIDSNKHEGKFEFRPLEPGYGLTVGNALRRVLLSSLEGFAITSVKMDNIEHEFTTIPGIVEDVTEIILNLKQVRLKRQIGGLLLLYIVYKLYIDVIKGAEKEENINVDSSSFFKAIWTVLLADFTMSLDNVLGVAGAAGDHYGLLVFGLVLSIILMATAATLISGWIKKYKWIAWLGLLAVLLVAVELIYTDIKILFF